MNRQIHVVGARPNFMKAAPVVLALSELGRDPMLVHTGQHYDPNMSKVFFEDLGLPEPEVNLGVGSGSHATQTAELMTSLESLFEDTHPSGVVVYGDVNSTLAASLAAVKLHIAIAHVEAGLRSFDRSMPEEVNRVVTDVLADLHFATTSADSHQLMGEGIPGRGIHVVGNSMIDSLLRFRENLDADGASAAYGVSGRYGVVTLHRPQNVDDARTVSSLVEGLRRIAGVVPLIFPLHPRGRRAFEAGGLLAVPSVHVLEPLGYVDFLSLVAGAALVVTDSGGLQAETAVLGVPCVTVRPNTEWRVTLEYGTNRLCSPQPDDMEESARAALASETGGVQIPLWDGQAGKRIARVLESWPAERRKGCRSRH